MSELSEEIAHLSRKLPAAHIKSLVALLEGVDAPTPTSRAQAKALLPVESFRAACDELWQLWEVTPGYSGTSLALALEAAKAATQQEREAESVQLVATGPSSWQVPVKQTKDVLLELIEGAQQKLFLLSFAAYAVPKIVEALRVAVVERGVQVTLLLETKDSGHLTVDAAAAFKDLGGMVTILVWPMDRRETVNGAAPTMHAKAAIADGTSVFITSANLTGKALDTNMELGVLIRGGNTPAKLDAHFEELIAEGLLRVA